MEQCSTFIKWFSDNALPLASLIIGAGGFTFGLIQFRRQTKIKSLELLFQLERRFDEPKLLLSRQKIGKWYLKRKTMPFPEDDAESILCFYETIGLAVKKNLLTVEDVYNSFFDWIITYQKMFKEKIKEDRNSISDYWSKFEYLANRLEKTFPKEYKEALFNNVDAKVAEAESQISIICDQNKYSHSHSHQQTAS